jgi:hypothetical protein
MHHSLNLTGWGTLSHWGSVPGPWQGRRTMAVRRACQCPGPRMWAQPIMKQQHQRGSAIGKAAVSVCCKHRVVAPGSATLHSAVSWLSPVHTARTWSCVITCILQVAWQQRASCLCMLRLQCMSAPGAAQCIACSAADLQHQTQTNPSMRLTQAQCHVSVSTGKVNFSPNSKRKL